MNAIRTALFLTLTLVSQSLFADIVWDSYRQDVKEYAVKNHKPLSSYSYARKVVMQKLHLEKDSNGYYIEDVYCHQTFRRSVGPNRMPSHNFINVEHTWPQSRFSSRANKDIQKADLHHLYPTESRSNSKRGNHYFSEVETDFDFVCDSVRYGYEPKSGQTAFEPPSDHKGNVARALFYFSVRYDIEIPDHEEFYLRMWNYSDPVDAEERHRNNVVEEVQGNRNPFIDDPEYADFITNF